MCVGCGGSWVQGDCPDCGAPASFLLNVSKFGSELTAAKVHVLDEHGPREGIVVAADAGITVMYPSGDTETLPDRSSPSIQFLQQFPMHYLSDMPAAARLFYVANDPWTLTAGYTREQFAPWIAAQLEQRLQQRNFLYHVARRKDQEFIERGLEFCNGLTRQEQLVIRANAALDTERVGDVVQLLAQLEHIDCPETLDLMWSIVPKLVTDPNLAFTAKSARAILDRCDPSKAQVLIDLLRIHELDRDALAEVLSQLDSRLTLSLAGGAHKTSEIKPFDLMDLLLTDFERKANGQPVNFARDPLLSKSLALKDAWTAVPTAMYPLIDLAVAGASLESMDDRIETLEYRLGAEEADELRESTPQHAAYLIARVAPELLTNAEVDKLGFWHERLRRDIEADRFVESELPQEILGRVQRRRLIEQAMLDPTSQATGQLTAADVILLAQFHEFQKGLDLFPDSELAAEPAFWPELARGISLATLVAHADHGSEKLQDFIAWTALQHGLRAIQDWDWDSAKQAARLVLACTVVPGFVAEAQNLLAFLAWTEDRDEDARRGLELAMVAVESPTLDSNWRLLTGTAGAAPRRPETTVPRNSAERPLPPPAMTSAPTPSVAFGGVGSEPHGFSEMDLYTPEEWDPLGPISEANGDGLDMMSLLWMAQHASSNPKSFGTGQVHWYRGDVFNGYRSRAVPQEIFGLFGLWAGQSVGTPVQEGEGVTGFFSTPMGRPFPISITYSSEGGGKLRLFTWFARCVPDGLEEDPARRSVLQWALQKAESAVTSYWGFRDESEPESVAIAQMEAKMQQGLARQGMLSDPSTLNSLINLATMSDVSRFPGEGGARFATFLPYAMAKEAMMLPTLGIEDDYVPAEPGEGTVFAGWQYDLPMGTSPIQAGINLYFAMYGGLALASLADLVVVNPDVLAEFGGEPFSAW